jgi:hypothetical protein
MVQVFKDKPIMPPRWNWQAEALGRMKELNFAAYLNKALDALLKR